MADDKRNAPIHRTGYILFSSSTNPIPVGSVGEWYDGTTVWNVAADGTQTPKGEGAPEYTAVDLVSASNIAGTYAAGVLTVTATGALTVDGQTATLGLRLLLATQTTTTQQGIYTVTTAGAGGISPVLTRATDQNASAAFINGALVASRSTGSTYGSTLWELSFTGAFTLDTTTPTWTQTATAVTLTAINTALASGHAVFTHAGWPKINNAADTFATTVGSLATATRATNLPDLAGTLAITGQASGATAPAFTGTTPLGAFNPTAIFSGTGQSSAGQVITTTDNQTMTLNQCAGMLFISATHGPYYILSNTAVIGAPAVLTVYGTAPTTDAGTYKIINGLAPVGTVASHTHTNG